MKVVFENVGRRYNRDWIFRNIKKTFDQGSSTALLGGNGSGKSTLAQLIMGYISPSEGEISWSINNNNVEFDYLYNGVAIAAPYLDLFEDFTMEESIRFQQRIKPFCDNFSVQEICKKIGIKNTDKPIKYFSSGMKQRVRLALAVMSNNSLLILDEPTSNLDHKGVDWYQQLVNEFMGDKTIIVCSNKQEYEYYFCKDQLNVDDYKK